MADLLKLDGRPRNLTDVVYEAIYDAIVGKVLPPGEALTEATIAERLGVSKTPVREAFLQLRKIGLLEPDGSRGLRVIRLSQDALRELYEVREALETFAAARCAERAEEDDHAAIRAAAERSLAAARAGDLAGFRECDRELHDLVARVGANARVREILDNGRTLIGTLRRRDFPHAEGSVACGEAHVRLAEAIAAGDAAAAARETRDHVRQVLDLMTASLTEA